jgi:hypothetical protein
MRERSFRPWSSGAAYFCLTVCCVATQLFAHSDPIGDIYPNVKVERGNFVIEFKNNEADYLSADERESRILRMIHSAEGALLSPRHVLDGSRDLNETLGTAAKEEARLEGEILTVARDGSTYSVAKSSREQVHHLPWPDDSKRVFQAVSADAESIGIAYVTNSMLFLSHFNRRRFTLAETVRITAPDTLPFIWDFPCVSNLVRVNGRYCIAWQRSVKTTSSYECVISTWKPGEPEPREIVLNEPADWNSHLSLAAIGDRLCLAYHCLADGYPARSRIITVFRTIPAN